MTSRESTSTAKNGPSRSAGVSSASKDRIPPSVLPKALRRGGARPLAASWPTKPNRPAIRKLSKRERAELQRGVHQRVVDDARKAKRRARLKAASA